MQKPEILKSKIIHKGWLELRTDTLKIPGLEKPYNYDIVKIGSGIAVLPFLDQTKVLLSRQYRHPIHDTLLELIQGGIKKGESIEKAAQRELLEETGYAGKIKIIKPIHLMAGSLDNTLYICRAVDLKKISEPENNSLEKMELVTYDFPTLLGEILSGQHKDSALNTAVLYHSLNPL